MVDYLILLPPSEGKTSGGQSNLSNLSFDDLLKPRDELIQFLNNFLNNSTLEEKEQVLELKGEKLVSAIQSNLNLKTSPTLPSIERYSGVMFNAINYSTLNDSQKTNFNNSVLFIDGLFGLLRPTDLIPDYKLKITTKFSDFNATKFWKENLSQIWPKLFKNKLVIDILPEAHRKVVDFSSAKETYQITFGEIINGKFKQAGHNSKKLKGELVRYLVSIENLTKKDLEDFIHSDGYSYSKVLSSDERVVYLKN